MIRIETQNIKKRFQDTLALNGIDLCLTEGIMHGIIGPEGAGKTTLFRSLMGLLRPDEGSILYYVDGNQVPFNQVQFVISYMPQQQSLYPDLSIREHLDFYRELYGLKAKDYLSRRDRLLEITRLGSFLERPAGKLSGGMYKKLGLMCALLSSPEVLLLDEPTNGVDPISRREFWQLLYDLGQQNILILVATAYMDEAERCTRVHLLDRGKLLDSGEPKALLKKSGVATFDEFFLKNAGDHLHD